MAHTAVTSCILVHYHEIALKGKNRPMFVRRLAENLRMATQGLGVKEVRQLTGRLVLMLSRDAAVEDIRQRVARVPGVANFALAYRTPLQLEVLKPAVIQALAGRTFRSFRVHTKRGYKAFPLTSPDINRDVGHYLQMQLGAAVDLERPELTVWIEILPHEALFFFERQAGPGGLPVGVSGTVACLLSGGIDSPVAAYRLLKRGCTVVFVHFHSYPILSRVSQEKVRDLTYDISIVPDQDCCTLFVPHNPVVRADRQAIAALEARLDTTMLIQQGLERAQVLEFVQEQGRVRVYAGDLKTTPVAEIQPQQR